MKFLRLALWVLVVWSSSTAFAQPRHFPPSEIILIGELHGTEEAPRLFGSLVTVAMTVAGWPTSKRMAVGLELPVELQRLIDEAVKDNTKTESFRQQLLADPIWQKINDGRSSQAMLDLICDTLQLAESRKVSLFFFDTSNPDRDRSMATFIGKYVREHRFEVTFILTGNIHANSAPHFPGMKTLVPMAYWLDGQGFTVSSYDVGYSAGDAWVCTPECGVHHLKGWKTTADAKNQEGYDGVLFVGTIHASPPARESLPSKEGQ